MVLVHGDNIYRSWHFSFVDRHGNERMVLKINVKPLIRHRVCGTDSLGCPWTYEAFFFFLTFQAFPRFMETILSPLFSLLETFNHGCQILFTEQADIWTVIGFTRYIYTNLRRPWQTDHLRYRTSGRKIKNTHPWQIHANAVLHPVIQSLDVYEWSDANKDKLKHWNNGVLS